MMQNNDITISLLGRTDPLLADYVSVLKDGCLSAYKSSLVTEQNRAHRLQEFTQQPGQLVILLVSQYDGLTRWMRQDMIMASALGAEHIMIALYDMDDETDPSGCLAEISDEVEAFANKANISTQLGYTFFNSAQQPEQGCFEVLKDIETALQDIAQTDKNEKSKSSAESSAESSDSVTGINPNQTSDQFGVYLAWYGKDVMLPGRSYHLKLDGQKAIATISALKHQIDPVTGAEEAVKTVLAGNISFCNISLDKPVGFEPFSDDRTLGQFTLYAADSDEAVAWGWIKFSLARATNLRWQPLEIDKAARAGHKQQKPFILWFTGLSGCGKSTIASLLEKKLHEVKKHTYVLDGDNVRHGLCRDLGFVDADRIENMRRVSETAKLFIDAGLIVMVSFISPFKAERQMVRSLFEEGEFFEVFVDTPIEICESRDIKGLYKKAREGKVPNFTGISSPYEAPKKADIHLMGNHDSAEEMTEILYRKLIEKGLI